MRFPSALGLSLSATLGCTAVNPAYEVSGTGNLSGTDTLSPTESTTGSVSSSGPEATSSTAPTTVEDPATSAASSGTVGEGSGAPPDVGVDAACWTTPISISDSGRLSPNTVLENVPVRIGISELGTFHAQSLRFYQDGALLPHELEDSGRIAWVRLPMFSAGVTLELEAVMGERCRPAQQQLAPSEVWSAGYVAVFHFDDARGTFVDSVHGIMLVAGKDSASDPNTWMLGPYLHKAGDGALQASDPRLNLSGSSPISTLGWVRLDPGHAGALAWTADLGEARHRELVSKLPGYRLSAVQGQTGPTAAMMPRPFFNIAQSIPLNQHDNVFGGAPLANGWTMLAGTFEPTMLSLYVNDHARLEGDADLVPGSDPMGTLRIGRWLHGDIDEIRISSVLRSPDWILFQYLSMTDQLVTLGTPTPL